MLDTQKQINMNPGYLVETKIAISQKPKSKLMTELIIWA